MKVDFIYVVHVPEYAEEITEAVKEADLILLEAVGGSSTRRAQVESAVNSVLGGDLEPQKIKGKVGPDPFLQRIVEALAGSGKQIKFIDISSEHPAYSLKREINLLEFEASRLLREGKIEESFQKSVLAINTEAEVLRAREDYVLEELSGLIPRVRGVKRVAVVQGAAHTRVHHQFARAFPEVSTQVRFARSPQVYPPGSSLVRKRLYFPEKSISEVEYRRAFVGDYLFYDAVRQFSKDERSRLKFSADLSSKLAPGDLEALFAQFSSLYEQYKQLKKDTFVSLDLRVAEDLTKEWAAKKGVDIPE